MVQKIRKILLILAVTMTVLTGCGTGEETTDREGLTVEENESIEEAIEDDAEGALSLITISMQNPLTLHPIYNMDKSVEQNLHLIFDTLVNIEEDGSISPNIAESWTYIPEENAVTLRIRDDIVWHDGERLTAEDVVFSLKTIQSASESPYTLSGQNIANVQALDAQTVRIDYRQSFSGIFQALFFPIVPQHIYDVTYNTSIALDPVGSGPYKYVSSVPHKYVKLEANPTYFDGKPSIEEVEIIITPNEETELHSFEQNLIDVIYTDVMNLGKYEKDQSAEIHELKTQYYEFMGVNFDRSLFTSQNIRDMLVYGLDRQRILEMYYLGHGIVTDTPISPYSYLYDQTLQIKTYDEEKAKLLLMEEGYTLDRETELFTRDGKAFSFNLLVNNENQDRLVVAEVIQDMYKDIGIEVHIEQVDGLTYVRRIENGQYDAFLGGWKLSYIPNLNFMFHSSQIQSGDNFVSYRDTHMDELLGTAYSASPYVIKEAYAPLQKYIAEQNPYISLYFRNGAVITQKKIGGNIAPDPLNIYANVQEWELKD